MFYWFLKWIALGPLLRLVFRPTVEGVDNVPDRGPGDPRQQPPLLRRLALHAADADPQGHVRGQGRVLHHPRHQGLAAEDVLLRRRPGADRPVRRRRRRGRAERRQAGPRRGRPVRHLPRGHPLPRRQALPRQDRRRPARARDRRPGHPGRGGRHRHRGPAGQEVRQLDPPARALRQAAGLLPLRGPGERPLHPALDHRRDHVRDHAALRPGVRRHVRHPRQGESKQLEQRPRRRRRRPTAAPRPTRPPTSSGRRPEPDAAPVPGPALRGRGPAVPRAGRAAGRRAGLRGRAEPLPRRQLRPPGGGRGRAWP